MRSNHWEPDLVNMADDVAIRKAIPLILLDQQGTNEKAHYHNGTTLFPSNNAGVFS